MAQSGQRYPDNLVDMQAGSTLHITLSIRSASGRDGPECGTLSPILLPGCTSVLPIRTTQSPVPIDIPGAQADFRRSPVDTTDVREEAPVPPSVTIKQETPTFSLGQPPLVESPMLIQFPDKIEEQTEAGLGEVMWSSCGRYPAPSQRTRASRRPEYDAATMSHFRQHLGVIDCRGLPVKPLPKPHSDWITGNPQMQNHALQDYQMQLMLLEQQKRKRLLMAKQQLEQNAQSAPEAQPHQVLKTEWRPSQGTAMTEQPEAEPLTGLDEKALEPQQAPNSRKRNADDEMSLMLLEQQSEKRLMQAKLEHFGPSRLDYKTQLMMLEEQNRRRLQAKLQHPGAPPADYQMQLMMLEQQNKKRLLHARMQKEASTLERQRLAREQAGSPSH